MNRFLILAYIFFCSLLISTSLIAQTPDSDLDSITEDSYQRMLERQRLEFVSDSLKLSVKQENLKEQKSIYHPWWYAFMLIAIVIAVFLIYGYYKKTRL